MMKARTLGLTLVIVACAGKDLDVGHDIPTSDSVETAGIGGTGGGGGSGGTSGSGGTGVGGTIGFPLASWPEQGGCATDPELAGLVGTWDGNLEDFYLNPIEHLRLVINGASSQGICGTVTWGTKAGPPPADDPDAIYPSPDYWAGFGIGGRPSYALSPIEGFEYTITGAGERLPTLRLGVQPSEPWRSYCAVQTPIHNQVNGWACTEQPDNSPGSSIQASYRSNPDDTCTVTNADGVTTYSEFHCAACGFSEPLCVCDEQACAPVTTDAQTFDLTLSADGLSLSGPYATAPGTTNPTWALSADNSTSGSFYLERIE